MQFITTNEDEKDDSDEMRAKLKEQGKGQLLKCRFCKGDHWTSQCPYKEIGGLDEVRHTTDGGRGAGFSGEQRYYLSGYRRVEVFIAFLLHPCVVSV